ncbi:MAG: nucleotidyltransferase domain-containing protein [Candidatus Pacearchaeota archaeon]|jgi:predicted nucleotidyltransferase
MAEKENKSSKPKSKKVGVPKLNLENEREVASDFGVKIYKKFDKIVKAVVLFGSSTKNTSLSTSDIDLVIVIDDVSVKWDQELISWYREELGKLVSENLYNKELHLTTVKLSTWWNDLMKGDPVIINMIRYGEAIIDIGGFFNPLKVLLEQGRIKPTPEAIYTALGRAPEHFKRSKYSVLGSIEGLFWTMVDSSQAALMAHNVSPPSPEQIPVLLKETFVDNNKLKIDYVIWFRDLYTLHRKIVHGDVTNIKGEDIDIWQQKTEDFLGKMIGLVKESLG